MPLTASLGLRRRCLGPVLRAAGLLLVVALPSGCSMFAARPVNPFVGDWTTPDHQRIAFRPDTVVIHSAAAPPTAMSAAACDGTFRFGYRRETRDALLALAPQQQNLRHRLGTMLAKPDYPVAEVTCGEGASTYVLLAPRDLVVIHRDNGIAGIEQLSRI